MSPSVAQSDKVGVERNCVSGCIDKHADFLLAYPAIDFAAMFHWAPCVEGLAKSRAAYSYCETRLGQTSDFQRLVEAYDALAPETSKRKVGREVHSRQPLCRYSPTPVTALPDPSQPDLTRLQFCKSPSIYVINYGIWQMENAKTGLQYLRQLVADHTENDVMVVLVLPWRVRPGTFHSEPTHEPLLAIDLKSRDRCQ